jgi:hypothetical protein
MKIAMMYPDTIRILPAWQVACINAQCITHHYPED